jgi:hypothetical protein
MPKHELENHKHGGLEDLLGFSSSVLSVPLSAVKIAVEKILNDDPFRELIEES